MNRKDFWKGFGTALIIVAVISIVWKPVARTIPWHMLPFEIGMSRSAKISMIEEYLDRYYVEEPDEKMIDDMLYTGMLAGVGDRYTYYLTAESLGQYMENANGHFEGIGLTVYTTEAGEVMVAGVMEGQPAEKAGIQRGDVIIGVDGEDMRGKTQADVADKIRGKAGTDVTVEVARKSTGATHSFTVTRGNVVLQTVESRMLQKGIGYIAVSGFKENTYEQFREAMQGLRTQGMQALLLDLRDNPGGLIKSVYQIGEELLPEGTMVYTVDNRNQRSDLICDEKYLDIPLVVLVNGNSASASEILSGAIKDRGVGTLVGTQTFGKGLVQRLFTLPDGSGLNITIQKYYTPNGTSIHGVGITPDEIVELPEAYQTMFREEIPAEEDAQLQRGVALLQEQLLKKEF